MTRRDDNVAIDLEQLLSITIPRLETKSPARLAAEAATAVAAAVAAKVSSTPSVPPPVTVATLAAAPPVKVVAAPAEVGVGTVAPAEAPAPTFHFDHPAPAAEAPGAGALPPKPAPLESKRGQSGGAGVGASDAKGVLAPRPGASPAPLAITNYRSDGRGFTVKLTDGSLHFWPKDKYAEYREATKHKCLYILDGKPVLQKSA